MIKKHFYITFDDRVPKNMVRQYNQVTKQQENSYEKDALGKAIFFGNEEELNRLNIMNQVYDEISQKEQVKAHEDKLIKLRSAMKNLKEKYPLEYEIVKRHFYGDNPQSITQIAREKNTYPQKIARILKRAYKHLRYCDCD